MQQHGQHGAKHEPQHIQPQAMQQPNGAQSCGGQHEQQGSGGRGMAPRIAAAICCSAERLILCCALRKMK